MNHSNALSTMIARRTFLARGGLGLGAAALSSYLNPQSLAAPTTVHGAIDPLHFAPKAKRVIFVCMAGGPSHLETFDYKPTLAKLDGKPMPKSYTEGMPIAQLQGLALNCYGPRKKFRKHGESGQEISDYLPHVAKIADDIAIVRSMVTEQINHDPAHTFMNTGTAISGRPSMGAWVTYGLGSESQSLPGFVVLTSVGGGPSQPIASRQWSAGFLPSRFQGVQFFSKGDPVHYVANPPGYTTKRQRQVVDAIAQLNQHRNATVHNPEIETRIFQYERAFRMQASVPELTDVSDEPEHVLKMYGAKPGDGSFASNCLLARRLAERGVRFIHLYHRGWDHHQGIEKGMTQACKLCDQPSAALIQDLKQRDMLKDTLVVWGGEFGRTPMAQGNGRDHHIKGFSMFLAGGGIKGGITHGATDELGYNAVEDVVHIRDLHATMLHLLGVDHARFTVRYQGLDLGLTGVERSHVVKKILA